MVEGEVRCITSRWDELELTMTGSQVSSCDNPFSPSRERIIIIRLLLM